ncbi:MAG: J domain-containing protein [Elainellaceae cyanobacterium]
MIRSDFIKEARYLQTIQIEREYKRGWIWHKLKDSFSLVYEEEVTWVGEFLRYKPGWAYHKIQSLAGESRILDDYDYQNTPRWSRRNPKVEHALTLFGVRLPIDRNSLKASYRKLAKRTHPDSGGNAEVFRNVQEAYELLLLEVAS